MTTQEDSYKGGFDGKDATKLGPFLLRRGAEIRLKERESTNPLTTLDKIDIIVQHLHEGPAEWANEFLGDNTKVWLSFEKFVQAMREEYADPVPQTVKATRALKITQRGRPVEEYIKEFKYKHAPLRWPNDVLIPAFCNGLDPEIKRAVEAATFFERTITAYDLQAQLVEERQKANKTTEEKRFGSKSPFFQILIGRFIAKVFWGVTIREHVFLQSKKSWLRSGNDSWNSTARRFRLECLNRRV